MTLNVLTETMCFYSNSTPYIIILEKGCPEQALQGNAAVDKPQLNMLHWFLKIALNSTLLGFVTMIILLSYHSMSNDAVLDPKQFHRTHHSAAGDIAHTTSHVPFYYYKHTNVAQLLLNKDHKANPNV